MLFLCFSMIEEHIQLLYSISKQGKLHEVLQKMSTPAVRRTAHFACWGTSPIPWNHWISPMAARFCETLFVQERIEFGSSFSISVSFSMPRMRSTFAFINMPHHVSEARAHMPLLDRAAQFSPFAALTGYHGRRILFHSVSGVRESVPKPQNNAIVKTTVFAL